MVVEWTLPSIDHIAYWRWTYYVLYILLLTETTDQARPTIGSVFHLVMTITTMARFSAPLSESRLPPIHSTCIHHVPCVTAMRLTT